MTFEVLLLAALIVRVRRRGNLCAIVIKDESVHDLQPLEFGDDLIGSGEAPQVFLRPPRRRVGPVVTDE